MKQGHLFSYLPYFRPSLELNYKQDQDDEIAGIIQQN